MEKQTITIETSFYLVLVSSLPRTMVPEESKTAVIVRSKLASFAIDKKGPTFAEKQTSRHHEQEPSFKIFLTRPIVVTYTQSPLGTTQICQATLPLARVQITNRLTTCFPLLQNNGTLVIATNSAPGNMFLKRTHFHGYSKRNCSLHKANMQMPHNLRSLFS